MTRRNLLTGALGAVLTLTLAGCGGGAASSAPAASSAAPASAAATVCSETADAGVIAVTIKGFAFVPADINAKVGEVIAFTNEDSAGHTASPLDGACPGTKTIAGGASSGLVFTVAGSYPFQCNIHDSMKGSITIS